MSGVTGKLWGVTTALEVTPFAELHRAEIRGGKCCSVHLHERKWNGFFVESGELHIRVYQPNGIEDVTVLKAGDYTAVGPGLKHRFESIEDTVLFELYWPSPIADDIVRDDVGGDL